MYAQIIFGIAFGYLALISAMMGIFYMETNFFILATAFATAAVGVIFDYRINRR